MSCSLFVSKIWICEIKSFAQKKSSISYFYLEKFLEWKQGDMLKQQIQLINSPMEGKMVNITQDELNTREVALCNFSASSNQYHTDMC